MDTKRCSRCKEEKSFDNFYKLKSGKFYAYCKACKVKSVWLQRNEGKTEEDFNTRETITKLREALPDGMRQCAHCDTVKHSDEFYACDDFWCKTCRIEMSRNQRKRGPLLPPKEKLSGRERLKYNCMRQMVKRAKHNNRGYVCTIAIDHIIIPDCCPVFGYELDLHGHDPERAPALDRIDNNKGYVPCNVVVVSTRANRIKHCTLLTELNHRRMILEANKTLSVTNTERKRVYDFYSMLATVTTQRPLNSIWVKSITSLE